MDQNKMQTKMAQRPSIVGFCITGNHSRQCCALTKLDAFSAGELALKALNIKPTA